MCFFLCFFSWGMLLKAQVPTVQDCLGAIPVCQTTYTETLSPVGAGNFPNEIHAGVSCVQAETNSIWYTFTTDVDGQFGFVISPNDPDDDYDWVLFDITNASCGDIFTDVSLMVSCNAAGSFGVGACNGSTGADGTSSFNIQGPGCGFNPPSPFQGFSALNALVNVQQGNTYVLMVNNWTGSTNGYTIDFGLSSAGVIDTDAPEIVSASMPETCGESTFEITFNEFIQCNSIADLNFSLAGPGGSYTMTLASIGCDAGGEFDKTFTVTVDPPVTLDGSYIFSLVTNGMDEVLDLCGNPATSVNFPFDRDFPVAPIVNLGADTSFCGTSLVLDATNDAATYQWQDGSADPTYTVSTPGTYAVTVTNDCGTDSDEIIVDIIAEIPIVDFGPDTTLCTGEILTLDVTTTGAQYIWTDGFQGPTITIDDSGIYGVHLSNGCGEGGDTIEVEYIPDIEPLDLGPDAYLCEEPVVLDVTAHEFATYQWHDGSDEPIYIVDQPGTYALTISSNCEVLVDTVQFFNCEACSVYIPNAFSPNDDGINDEFTAYSNCQLESYKLQIFDRWGGHIFNSEDPTMSWDGKYRGKRADTGVYIYLVEYIVTENGVSSTKIEAGDITLIR